jgi:hypothetical protein
MYTKYTIYKLTKNVDGAGVQGVVAQTQRAGQLSTGLTPTT